MDSTAPLGEVLNAPEIHSAALRCMQEKASTLPLHLALSKYHSHRLYVMIGTTQEQ